jgi:hypothetical protein
MSIPFTVTYSTKGKDPLHWIARLQQSLHFELQGRLVELGELTAERMGEIIQESIKRPPAEGILEKSIQSEILNSTGGVMIGIGRVINLPPYWEVLNDGGYLPPSTVGYFGEGNPPIKGASGEKWTDDSSQYPMTPKKLTEPVKYIEISNEELRGHIEKELNRLMGGSGFSSYGGNQDIT